MMLSDNGIVHSANHATARTHLNVYETQQACEANLPGFVFSAYPEFNPRVHFLNHQILMIGAAESPIGHKHATWRCIVIFVPDEE